MKEIPFEKVSVDEARRVLHGDVARPVAAPPARDWSSARLRHSDQSPPDLSPIAFKWLAVLPREARPNALAQQYPRIANRLAEIWKRPLQCERYIDGLMMDLRGGRKGFPKEVAAEIAALKVHFLRTTNSVHFGIWGNRIGVD